MSDTIIRKVVPVCARCYSDDVTRDAVVKWDSAKNDWSVCTVFDNSDCQSCGGEADLVDIDAMEALTLNRARAMIEEYGRLTGEVPAGQQATFEQLRGMLPKLAGCLSTWAHELDLPFTLKVERRRGR